MKLLPLLLILSTSVAQCQDFPFSISQLAAMQHMNLNSINESMVEANMVFCDASNGDDNNFPIVRYRLPSGLDFNRDVALVDFEYCRGKETNRVLINLYDIAFHYNKLLNELLESEFKLIKAYKKTTSKHDDAVQIYQNSRNTVYCILRDHEKNDRGTIERYEADYTYYFWIVSNSDYKKNLR